jgi:hypothetical protein
VSEWWDSIKIGGRSFLRLKFKFTMMSMHMTREWPIPTLGIFCSPLYVDYSQIAILFLPPRLMAGDSKAWLPGHFCVAYE